MTGTVLCGDCGGALGEAHDLGGRKPCPTCGGAVRAFGDALAETVDFNDAVKWRHERPGKAKPVAEGMAGRERSRGTGRVVNKESLFDRENDRRYERVDGKVIHDHGSITIRDPRAEVALRASAGAPHPGGRGPRRRAPRRPGRAFGARSPVRRRSRPRAWRS